MKKRSFIRVFAMLLFAMMLLTACSSGSSGASKKSSSKSNTYETPVEIMIELQNPNKVTDFTKMITARLNGLAEKEVKAVLKALSKSDDIQDRLDDYAEQYSNHIDDMKDEYGDDYKCTYKIEDKVELEKEDLRDFEEQINYFLKEPNSLIENTKDFDPDEWADLADFLGMNNSHAKAYVSALEDLCEELGDIKVEEGYELQLVVTLNSNELDEPDEAEYTMRVYKVNGRWISEDAASTVYSYINMLVYN